MTLADTNSTAGSAADTTQTASEGSSPAANAQSAPKEGLAARPTEHSAMVDIFKRMQAEGSTPGEGGEPAAVEGTVAMDGQGGTEAPQGDQPPKEDLDKAPQVLKRWKYPDRVIESMTPQELLDLANEITPVQAESDRVGNQLREMTKKLEAQASGEAQPEKSSEAAKAGSTQKGQPDDFDRVLEEGIYDDLAKPIAQRFEKITAEYRSEIQKRDALLQQVFVQMDRVQLGMARSELQGDFPQLKDSAKFNKVVDRVYNDAARLPPNAAIDIPKLMREAAVREFGTDVIKQQQDRLSQKFRQQSQGQPVVSSASSQRAGGLSRNESLREAFRMLESGKDPDTVARELAGSQG